MRISSDCILFSKLIFVERYSSAQNKEYGCIQCEILTTLPVGVHHNNEALIQTNRFDINNGICNSNYTKLGNASK